MIKNSKCRCKEISKFDICNRIEWWPLGIEKVVDWFFWHNLDKTDLAKVRNLHEFVIFWDNYCCNTYLLSYSMVQSPSWAANYFAVSQEIPRISRNPKVHYRTHKRPPPVSILVQPNPVHIPTSHLLEIHPNINHPSRPRSPQWSPTLQFILWKK